MTEAHATPPSTPTGGWTDDDVEWFGVSRRKIGQKSDCQYGWLRLPDGGVAIVKAMDLDLVAYNRTLLDHERRMLQRLQALGGPTPEWLDLGRDDWLATRFAGLSLSRLNSPIGPAKGIKVPRLPARERLAVWIHVLRRADALAQQGVLVMDLYDANVVIPMTQGLSGQLRLNQAVLIDHGFSMEAGMNMRRPAWMGLDERIAPELVEALRHDQDALRAHFARLGAVPPGARAGSLSPERDRLSRKAWAEYDAPQALQQLVDSNQIDCGQAMQFAVAKAIEAGPWRELASSPLGRPLAVVLQTMQARAARDRFARLQDAADALEAVVNAVPLVSAHHYPKVSARDLAPEPQPALDDDGPNIDAGPVTPAGTKEPGTGFANETPERATAPWRDQEGGALGSRWIPLMLGLGAAAGMMLPLPW